jgi:cell division protein FtsL
MQNNNYINYMQNNNYINIILLLLIILCTIYVIYYNKCKYEKFLNTNVIGKMDKILENNYTNLNKSESSNSKNAIFMLIFSEPHYMIGAVIAASVHKKLLLDNNIMMDIVCMVDDNIYKYKDELLKYFDRVILIDMIKIKLHNDLVIYNRYSKWMQYSITKWCILQYDEYDKILFCDIDLLPIDKQFYNIFNINSFGIFVTHKINTNSNQLHHTYVNKCDNFNMIANKSEFFETNDEIINYNNIPKDVILKQSINATLLLAKPNKQLYNEYLDFIKLCEFNGGYNSFHGKGVDETTMFLFLIFYKEIECKYISCEYAIIPREFNNKYNYEIKAINYATVIKPWLKMPMLCFTDEIVWHKLITKIIDKKSRIYTIYLKNLISQLYKFINVYNEYLSNNRYGYNYLDNVSYNMESLSNPNLKKDTLQLIHFLNNNQYSNDVLFINNIINKTNTIYEKMTKYSYFS